MRTTNDSGAVIWGQLAERAPTTHVPPSHPPVESDLELVLTRLGIIVSAATRLAHRLLTEVKHVSTQHVATLSGEPDPEGWRERAFALRALADDLTGEAVELSPLLTQGADICSTLAALTGGNIVPGETV